MHLHPKWQWNIVNALSSVFENVQFIIATHSPIVISSSKEPNIILLEENKEPTYLPDCYGYSVEDILRYRQESVSRPKMINILINMPMAITILLCLVTCVWEIICMKMSIKMVN